MEQGEVCWARLQGPAGFRPTLILTRSWIIPRLTKITVAPISTSVRNIPTHVKLTPVDDGVDQVCAINLDGIQTIDKVQFTQKIVRLRHDRMEQIFAAIRIAFEMP